VRSNPTRLPGFYWVRFEGEVVVAEYTDGRGCEGSGGRKHWHIPGSESCFKDREVCELLSFRLEPHEVKTVLEVARIKSRGPE